MNIDRPIPVTILTGFLGAGKSTLLNEFLAGDDVADTAVIVNEFGDISIDHDLIRVNQRELIVPTTGCLCCTAGSDIRSSLFQLYEALESQAVPPFKRVIVETTGLADPAPIINQITLGGVPAVGYRDGAVATTFRLSGVVCAIDVATIEQSIERHFECIKQLAFADLIVLTKTDIALEAAAGPRLSELLATIRQINRRCCRRSVRERLRPRQRLCAAELPAVGAGGRCRRLARFGAGAGPTAAISRPWSRRKPPCGGRNTERGLAREPTGLGKKSRHVL